jgi:hypothetical protein
VQTLRTNITTLTSVDTCYVIYVCERENFDAVQFGAVG